MGNQNTVKRTAISFSIALATAFLSLLIQNYTTESDLKNNKFEAKVYPKASYLMKK
ncbi:MAG: hypothetical protein JKY48_03640 [Flavobacteriales bacterium]|nr:hypothetical protein [Flavobacteriales bacterium]